MADDLVKRLRMRDPTQTRLQRSLNQDAADRIEELERMLEPAHVFDPNNWECTYDAGDLSILWDGAGGNGPFRTAALARLPDRWAALEKPDSREFVLFDSEAEATAHLASGAFKDDEND